jgi:hypothetical protein
MNKKFKNEEWLIARGEHKKKAKKIKFKKFIIKKIKDMPIQIVVTLIGRALWELGKFMF